MTTSFRLKITNAQIVTVCQNNELFKSGTSQNEISIIENGTIIVNHDGLIHDLGPTVDLELKYPSSSTTFSTEIDGTGKSIIPGLVDGHTHPVWSGDRCHEFSMKLSGATYMDIHKMGGGIGYTVGKTRESSQEELEALFLQRLDRMVNQGTTTIEAKTGYGLDTETEIKMLKVINKVAKEQSEKVDIVPNFLIHSIPKGKTAQETCEYILNDQLPTLEKGIQSGELQCELVDIFCEKGVFEIEESRAILTKAKEIGLLINFHGDELHPIKSAELGYDVDALSISHLECISDEGIEKMAEKNIFGVLLPTTAYILKLVPPPARKMIEKGVPIVLASDYNPNAHCLSLPFVMNLGCVMMKMTMNEALVATTINAAASLNKSKTHGSLEVGKFGDMVIIGASNWEHIIYEMVDPPIEYVIKKGNVVVKK